MNDDEIKYKGFLTVWKALGQTRPEITYEERFITAIVATSDDKFERAKRINSTSFGKLRGKGGKLIGN